MGKKKNKTRNVASFVRPGDKGVRLYLPNSKSIRFNTAAEALRYLDTNYPDGSLERYTGKQKTEQPLSPPKKVHYASEDLPIYIDSGRKGIDKLIGLAAPSSRFMKAYNRIGMDPIFNDVRVENMERDWKNNPEYMQYAWTDTGNEVGTGAALIAALPILGSAVANPYVSGAMNLYGAYEGLGRLTSDEGVAKTWNKFSQGDWKGGLQSLGGDAFDVAMSLPFLNRMRQGVTMTGNAVKTGSRTLAGNYAAKLFTRMSPYYDFSFDWRTGKFNLTPKPGMSGAATSVAKSEMLPGLVRELPGTTLRALGPAPATQSARAPELVEEAPVQEARPIEPTIVAREPIAPDDLPPAPAEVNNVAEASSTRPYDDFDWDLYDTQAEPVVPPTPQVGLYDELLGNTGYLRNPDGSWTHNWDNGTFTFGNNGEATFDPRWRMPSIQLLPDEIERFIRTRYDNVLNLDGPFRSLNDFVIRNQYPLGNVRYSNRDNSWRFNYRHPSGIRFPIRLNQEPNGSIGIRMENDLPAFIPTTSETTAQEVYDGIMNYARGILVPELTTDQLSLILSMFPNEIPTGSGNRMFLNTAGTRNFVYNPLELTFSTRGVGYRRFDNEPIANLTLEALGPIKAPTIITSSNLPIFSEISLGTDWGKVLGIDSKYNSQIDFGLLRPRPTELDVIRVLGNNTLMHVAPNGDIVDIYADHVNPRYSTEYPLIWPTNEVPTLHINMLPSGDYLEGDASKWLATQMSKINRGLKGIDLTSTGNMNPTLSRFISDLKTDPNLSDLDKHNILVDLINNPNQYFREYPNRGDYSPYSFTENAIKEGSSPKKYFTEPSISGTVGRFNTYGNNVGLAKANRGGLGLGLLKSMNPEGTELEHLSRKILYPAMNNFIQTKFPYLVNRFGYNPGTTPFIFTTIRKKGGKLVKKKLINGKKTCK